MGRGAATEVAWRATLEDLTPAALVALCAALLVAGGRDVPDTGWRSGFVVPLPEASDAGASTRVALGALRSDLRALLTVGPPSRSVAKKSGLAAGVP